MIVNEDVRVPLPTPFGVFDVRAFERSSGYDYVAMIYGDLGDGEDVLARVHSECLTGDALHSLRCDCGVQLEHSLRTIAAEQRGVLVYATGHEGRGIGLVNKLRAYVAQDRGADTVDANLLLGLAVDGRSYDDAAKVLSAVGVRSVRLLSNNPSKVRGLRAAGVTINSVIPLPTSPHVRNVGYLTTKADRLGHAGLLAQTRTAIADDGPAVDVMDVLGAIRPPGNRPFVAVKYAQSVDGRIATSTGDARWISGEAERRLAHALRAACDAVLVGVDTVIRDQPQLTVRMVAGASPRRVVLDSTLRVPASAAVLDADAPTTVITTDRSSAERRQELRARGVSVEVVGDVDGRVDLRAALTRLHAAGTESVLVEGGAKVITSLLSARLVDRLIVSVAPLVIGSGIEAVGSLGTTTVSAALRLANRSVHLVGEDVVLAWDVTPAH